MTKATKCITYALLLGILGVLLFQAFHWKSPGVNYAGESNIYTCIQQDENKLHFKITNKQRAHFYIDFVQNSKPSCLNPYFLAIHIQTEAPHNAWVHMVYTDSKASQWRTFIDAENIANKNSPYPFYTYDPDFYDVPLWTYSLFSKPLSFWKGHAFAVEVNHHHKTIKCLGGIEWGFELHFKKLRPVAMQPRLLEEEVWEQAWQLLQGELSGYKCI